MTTYRRSLGQWGEDQAARFLERQGFRVVERNYRATVGEIDLVAVREGDWYFIEVKTRRAGALANDLSITPAKKRKFEKTVRHYCYHRSVSEGSFIMAGLLVVVHKTEKLIRFRLAVFC